MSCGEPLGFRSNGPSFPYEIPAARWVSGGSTVKSLQHRVDPQVEIGERVDDACHDVNSALSTIVLCVDFLAQDSQPRADEALQDVRAAVRKISIVMAGLRGDLSSADSSGKTSAVVRRSYPVGVG